MGISKFQPQQWRQKHSEEGARKEVSRASFFTVGALWLFLFHFNLRVKFFFFCLGSSNIFHKKLSLLFGQLMYIIQNFKFFC
jgi:hypothetical protein